MRWCLSLTLGAHNFLDAAELPTLKLPLNTSQVLEVKVADGSIIKILGVCHGVTVLIQGYKFVVDFNVLHLGWCAVVLGTQWLCTLGEIICDFKLLTMRICYLGMQGLHMSPSTFSEADKLFSSSEKKGLVLQLQLSTMLVLMISPCYLLPCLTCWIYV